MKALRWYLDRVKSYRKHEQLFLAVQEPHAPVSRDTVSRWIGRAIQAAGRDALIDSSTPHAYDTRAVSASWALFARIPMEGILKDAYRRSSNSFIANYLRDIPATEGSFSRADCAAAAESRPTP